MGPSNKDSKSTLEGDEMNYEEKDLFIAEKNFVF